MFELTVRDGLTLHMRALSDAQELFNLIADNRGRLEEWMPWANRTTEVGHAREYLTRCLQGYESGTSLDLGIMWHGRYVGSVGLHDIDPVNRTSEIGYWLSEEVVGQGIMTDSVAALMSYAFQNSAFNLYRITLRCAEGNDRSAGVALRTGFTHESTLEAVEWYRGEPRNELVWRLLRPEWETVQDFEQMVG